MWYLDNGSLLLNQFVAKPWPMSFWYSSGENGRCALFGSANDDDSPAPERENLARIATNKRKPNLVSKRPMTFLLELKAFTSLAHLLSTTTPKCVILKSFSSQRHLYTKREQIFYNRCHLIGSENI